MAQDDVDNSLRESELLIQRSEALISAAKATLERADRELADLGVTPELLAKCAAEQSPEHQAELEKEVQAFKEELDRDLPSSPPSRAPRVNPMRQRI